MGRIVQLEGRIEIPVKVENYVSQFHPEITGFRRIAYITIFRIGMMFGKRIELWNRR